jgi:hypothetical protein
LAQIIKSWPDFKTFPKLPDIFTATEAENESEPGSSGSSPSAEIDAASQNELPTSYNGGITEARHPDRKQKSDRKSKKRQAASKQDSSSDSDDSDHHITKKLPKMARIKRWATRGKSATFVVRLAEGEQEKTSEKDTYLRLLPVLDRYEQRYANLRNLLSPK